MVVLKFFFIFFSVTIFLLVIVYQWLLRRTLTSYIPSKKERRISFPGRYPSKGESVVHYFSDTNTVYDKKSSLKVVSLNMERGKQFDKVLEQLRNLDADIIFLQEVDYFHRRTDLFDFTGELAIELGMNGVFHCGYDEGPYCRDGNAILSKFPIVEEHAIRTIRRRNVVKQTSIQSFAILDTPLGKVGCGSIHLGAHYTGPLSRKEEWESYLKGIIPIIKGKDMQLIFGGDFNTICTGIGKFNIPKYVATFSDFFILTWFGWSEAMYFEKFVTKEFNETLLKENNIQPINDPFPKNMPTFSGISGLYQAKLDHIFCSDTLHVTHYSVGNQEKHKCSDHMWISITVENNK